MNPWPDPLREPGPASRTLRTLERAVALAEEQLKVNPRDASLLADLADAHSMLRAREPGELSARALKLAPDDGDVLRTVADVDEALGRREAALQKIARAIAGLSALADRAEPVARGAPRGPALPGRAEGHRAAAGREGEEAAVRRGR